MPNKINARYIEGLPVIGFGQTYQNVTASRSPGITYTNDTGRPIFVCVIVTYVSNGTASLSVDGLVVQSINHGLSGFTTSISVLVPSGSTYAFAGQRNQWFELR